LQIAKVENDMKFKNPIGLVDSAKSYKLIPGFQIFKVEMNTLLKYSKLYPSFGATNFSYILIPADLFCLLSYHKCGFFRIFKKDKESNGIITHNQLTI